MFVFLLIVLFILVGFLCRENILTYLLTYPGNLTCGLPQGSILGTLLFLLYVNDMPQFVSCDLLLYADDSCLVFSDKNFDNIEDQLNENFNSICDWFVDNMLSIHFGEDKTKSILFGTKRKLKRVRELDIRHRDVKIKQHTHVTYLGCVVDSSLTRVNGTTCTNKNKCKIEIFI